MPRRNNFHGICVLFLGVSCMSLLPLRVAGFSNPGYVENLIATVADPDEDFFSNVAAEHLSQIELSESHRAQLLNLIFKRDASAYYGARVSAYVDVVSSFGPEVIPQLLERLPQLRNNSWQFVIAAAVIGRNSQLNDEQLHQLYVEFQETPVQHRPLIAAVVLNCGHVSQEMETTLKESFEKNPQDEFLIAGVILMRPADWVNRMILPGLIEKARRSALRVNDKNDNWLSTLLTRGLVLVARSHEGFQSDSFIELLVALKAQAVRLHSLDAYFLSFSICHLRPADADDSLRVLFLQATTRNSEMHPGAVLLRLQNGLYAIIQKDDPLLATAEKLLLGPHDMAESQLNGMALLLHILGPLNATRINRLLERAGSSDDHAARRILLFVAENAVTPTNNAVLTSMLKDETDESVQSSLRRMIEMSSGHYALQKDDGLP